MLAVTFCRCFQMYQSLKTEASWYQSGFQTLQNKVHHLEMTLSAENRLKQELFTALSDARRENEIVKGN